MAHKSGPKILVTSPSFSKNETLRNEMINLFPKTIFNDTKSHFSSYDFYKIVKKCDGVIVSLEKIDKHLLKKLPNLKIIAKYGVGIDNIDLHSCQKYGVKAAYTFGVNKLSVAEMTVSLMIGLVRNIFFSSYKLKHGNWKKDGGENIERKTIGIIGVGNIGKEVIRLIKPFNCRIIVNDIINQDDFYMENSVIEVQKEEIFSNSDIISIHTPLTKLTKHLINKETLKKMKKNSFLINTARGKIVKQDDLKYALKHKLIAGAALDVFETEPPKDKEFLELPNLIPTPHIGGNSVESVLAMGREAIRHLKEYFYG